MSSSAAVLASATRSDAAALASVTRPEAAALASVTRSVAVARASDIRSPAAVLASDIRPEAVDVASLIRSFARARLVISRAYRTPGRPQAGCRRLVSATARAGHRSGGAGQVGSGRAGASVSYRSARVFGDTSTAMVEKRCL